MPDPTQRPATAPPRDAAVSRLGYRPELDGVRAIAIIVVVAIHYTDLPSGGLLGVDMFFTLSGFLITTLLLEEWQAAGRVSLRDFYLRRFFRLFPGLAALVAAYVLYIVLFGRGDESLGLSGAAYAITYTANWAIALGWRYPSWAIGHLWSLAVEEQFYLVWPTLLVVLTRRRLGLRGIAWTLAGMIVAIGAWRYLLYLDGADGARLYFATDTRFDELLIGCLAGTIFVSRGTERAVPRWAPFATAAAALFVVWNLLDTRSWATQWSGGLTLFAAAVAVTIYGCVVGWLPVLTRALGARWLVFVGTISYSLYLWHVAGSLVLQRLVDVRGPVLVVSEIALSFAAACVSYFVIEVPFVRRRKAYRRLRSTKTEAELAPERMHRRREPAAVALPAPIRGASEPPQP
jgi:peptidoglycan/LPS O-acetylase OafA/YrhL